MIAGTLFFLARLQSKIREFEGRLRRKKLGCIINHFPPSRYLRRLTYPPFAYIIEEKKCSENSEFLGKRLLRGGGHFKSLRRCHILLLHFSVMVGGQFLYRRGSENVSLYPSVWCSPILVTSNKMEASTRIVRTNKKKILVIV